MDAAALLRSQGWAGQGHSLAPHKPHSLKRPLMVSKKIDVLGLGIDKNAALSDQWWMRAFDSSLKSFGTGTEGVLASVKTHGAKRGGLYGRFVKGEGVAATFEVDVEVKEGQVKEGALGNKPQATTSQISASTSSSEDDSDSDTDETSASEEEKITTMTNKASKVEKAEMNGNAIQSSKKRKAEDVNQDASKPTKKVKEEEKVKKSKKSSSDDTRASKKEKKQDKQEITPSGDMLATLLKKTKRAKDYDSESEARDLKHPNWLANSKLKKRLRTPADITNAHDIAAEINKRTSAATIPLDNISMTKGLLALSKKRRNKYQKRAKSKGTTLGAYYVQRTLKKEKKASRRSSP